MHINILTFIIFNISIISCQSDRSSKIIELEYELRQTKDELKKCSSDLLDILSSYEMYSQKSKLLKEIETKVGINVIKTSIDKDIVAVAEGYNRVLFYDTTILCDIIILNNSDNSLKFNLKGHEAKITSLDFSADSKLLLSCDQDHRIIIWDLLSGNEVYTFKSAKKVDKVRFINADKELIAINKYGKNAFIYDLKGNLVNELSIGHEINEFEINKKKREIIFFCHKRIQSWTIGFRWKKSLDIPYDGVKSARYSHDYSKIALGLYNGDIRILNDNLEEKCVLKGHFKPVLSLNFSFDDKKIISSSSDQTARVWNLNERIEMVKLMNIHEGDVNAADFISTTDNFMTGGDNEEIKIWRTKINIEE